MPMSSHGSLHQFATLRLKTYILARKGRELLVACRPPRGLTPPIWLVTLYNGKGLVFARATRLIFARGQRLILHATSWQCEVMSCDDLT